jgi:signal transduction histidine kinase
LNGTTVVAADLPEAAFQRAGGLPLDAVPDAEQPRGPRAERRCALETPHTGDGRIDELRRELANVRASRRRLLLAGDEERRSIERALHDGLQQRLVGLAANVELATASADADATATIALLASMREDVQQALDDARQLAHRIFPPLLEAGGLRPGLRAAAADAGVRVAFDGEQAASPPEIVTAIYFCGVDAFESAGAGSSVTVTVRSEDRSMSFEIRVDRDLGAGWTPPSLDRVEALGGQLNVEHPPGEGARIVGSLPLPR